MSQYKLLLAHPAICSDLESQSLYTDTLKQQAVNFLRYSEAVDILAPVFDMSFFQQTVVQTLQNATFGMLLSDMCLPLCAACMAVVWFGNRSSAEVQVSCWLLAALLHAKCISCSGT